MDKIYGGNAKLITTKFGEIWKVSQKRSDLEKLLKYMNDNDTEWVNLDIKEKPQKVEGKATHYLELYQPDKTKANNKPTEKAIYNQGPERARVSNSGFEFDSQYQKDEKDTLPF